MTDHCLDRSCEMSRRTILVVLAATACAMLATTARAQTSSGIQMTPDSRRYAALGDAVTVPVAEWIGKRIAA